MALTKRGEYRYGDVQADIQEELVRYSKLNGYVAQHFANAACACSGTIFRLALDDEAGAAVRTCIACKSQHPIADSGDYLDDAQLEDAPARAAARNSKSPWAYRSTRKATTCAGCTWAAGVQGAG